MIIEIEFENDIKILNSFLMQAVKLAHFYPFYENSLLNSRRKSKSFFINLPSYDSRYFIIKHIQLEHLNNNMR